MSLHVQESGPQNDTTILFLHGLGVSGWMWTDQIEALAPDYHCLNVDLPGGGESYESDWVSFADTADQLAILIRERARSGKAHVVGLSLGGYAALHLLERHPDCVDSMIVSGVTTRPFARAWLWRALVRVMSRAIRWEPVIRLNAKMMQLPEDVLPLYRRDSKRLSRDGIRRVYEEVLSFELTAELGQREHRVLAVAGGAEAKKIVYSLPDFPAFFPNGRAYVAPRAHHGWNAELPEVFTAMIRAWVDDQELPAELDPVVYELASSEKKGVAA